MITVITIKEYTSDQMRAPWGEFWGVLRDGSVIALFKYESEACRWAANYNN